MNKNSLIVIITVLLLINISQFSGIVFPLQTSMDNKTESTNLMNKTDNQTLSPQEDIQSRIEPNGIDSNDQKHTVVTKMITGDLHELTRDEIAEYPLEELPSEDLIIILNSLSAEDLEKTLFGVTQENLKILFNKIPQDSFEKIVEKLPPDKREEVSLLLNS